MEWSRLKKILEDNICDSLKGRVTFNITHYRSQSKHEPESKFWITLDKRVIFKVSKLAWLREWSNIIEELRTNPEQSSDIRGDDVYSYVEGMLFKKGIVSYDYVYEALRRYFSMPFEEAVTSGEFIIKALVIIDRRFGKRRLQDLTITETNLPLIKELYGVRFEAEGLYQKEVD